MADNNVHPYRTASQLLRLQTMAVMEELNEDCLRVLLSQAQAMLKGHKEYGPLDLKNYNRDALVEALEELRDTSNYLTFRILQLTRYNQ